MMATAKHWLLLALLALAVTSGPMNPPLRSVQATFPGENGRIVFVSYRGWWSPPCTTTNTVYVPINYRAEPQEYATDSSCDPILLTMNPDGSDVQQIFSWGGGLASPSWSPDGRSIAVSVWGSGAASIHLLIPNPSGDMFKWDTKLTSGQDGHPTWSPDGQKIAFDRWDPSLNAVSREIYEVNADGTGLTMMNKGADPSWSPDGKRIAFDDQGTVWVIGAEGRLQVSFGVMPDWSPDGKKIVVSNFRDGQIYVVNADGTGSETQLTTIGHNEFPSWSPDGKMIVFTSDREGELPPDLVKDPASQQRSTWNIYVMNADGSDQHSLTSRSFRCCADFFPTWQSVAIPAATASVTTTPGSGTSSTNTAVGPIVIEPIVVAVVFIVVIVAVVFALILAVRNARPSSRICKRCGAVNPKYAKTYCVQCGEPLRN